MIPAASTPPRMATLVLLTALSVLSINLFLPSLSTMAEDFGADYAVVALAVAGYLGITAVLMLVIGPLSDRFGRRPVLLVAIAVFALASLGCTLSTGIWTFLAFRALQGTVIAGWAVSLAVIRDMVPARDAASRIGYVTMAMAVAPMLAPTLGGVLDELWGWRASFVLLTALGAAAFVLCWADLGETHRKRPESFARQLEAYPALLRSPRFWGFALCMAFSIATFHAFLAGAPLVASTLYGLSPTLLGIGMGSITGGFTLGSFLSGRLASRHALTTMMLGGRTVACAGLLTGLALYGLGLGDVLVLFGAAVLVGLGNGLTTPSSNAGVLSVRPDLAGSAAGLAGALVSATGALATSITGTVVERAPGAYGLLGVMLGCALLALAAALAVRRSYGRGG